MIAWHYFNAVLESSSDYAQTFLVIAPNLTVFERLKDDFDKGNIFQRDPIIPKECREEWDMQFYMRGEQERATSKGALYLTNIHRLYDGKYHASDAEPDIMTTMVGPPVKTNITTPTTFATEFWIAINLLYWYLMMKHIILTSPN